MATTQNSHQKNSVGVFEFWCYFFLDLHCSVRIRLEDQAKCSNLCHPITLIGRLPDAESHPLGSCNMPSASVNGSPLNQHHKRSTAACGQQDTTVATRSWSILTSRTPQHPRKRNPRLSDIVRIGPNICSALVFAICSLTNLTHCHFSKDLAQIPQPIARTLSVDVIVKQTVRDPLISQEATAYDTASDLMRRNVSREPTPLRAVLIPCIDCLLTTLDKLY